MEVQFLRLLCVSYVNVCLGDVLPLKHELLSHESNRSHPMHGEIIFRIKGRVIVQDKFIVFLDSKFETRSSIIETRDSILEKFKESRIESQCK